jgi:nucleoid DNA-binding protein
MSHPIKLDCNLLATSLSHSGYGSKSQAREIVAALIEDQRVALRLGHTVHLKGLGRFEVVDVPERQRQNPKTHQPITVPAHRTIKFRPSKVLLAEMNR